MEGLGVKAAVDQKFWLGKRVFLTGHTGFKGSWLSLWLQSLGAVVKGYALPPPTEPSLFIAADVAKGMESEIADIRDLPALKRSMQHFRPDVLVHMAAQSLVRYSYANPVETFATNVMGTVNVLEAARSCDGLGAIVNVTTDKCYENLERMEGYREDEPLGGHDPYSSSKACSELVTAAYRRSFFQLSAAPVVASARAGNVIGGGDWAADRLIPDILRAFAQSEPVTIRNPNAVRPWQHVLEPLSGYLVLAQAQSSHGADYAGGWNFGPNDGDAKPVNWIVERMIDSWGKGASWRLDDATGLHEANYLKLDCSKAHTRLHWHSTWPLAQALDRVVSWHQAWQRGENMRAWCIAETEEYTRDMRAST